MPALVSATASGLLMIPGGATPSLRRQRAVERVEPQGVGCLLLFGARGGAECDHDERDTDADGQIEREGFGAE